MSKLPYVLYPKCRHPTANYEIVGREKVVYICPECQKTYIISHCKRCFSHRIGGTTKTHKDGIRKTKTECQDCGYIWMEYEVKGK